jgi:hypothetical protein
LGPALLALMTRRYLRIKAIPTLLCPSGAVAILSPQLTVKGQFKKISEGLFTFPRNG